MNMSNIDFEITTLLRFLENNPVALLRFLACACAVTLIIAIVTDAILLRRQAAQGPKTSERRPMPRSDLMLRSVPQLEMAKADSHSLPRDKKQPKF